MTEMAPEPGPEQVGLEGEPAPEEAPWQGPSQEEWAQTQQALQSLGPLAQQWQEMQEQQGETERPTVDQFSDEFMPQLDAYIEHKFEERVGPLQTFAEQQQEEEAEQRAMDIIADVATREGDFLFTDKIPGTEMSSPDLARALADRFIFEESQRYGRGPQAAEQALVRAVKVVRTWEQSVGKAYHEREMNQIGTLAGARREPGAAGNAAGQQLVTPEGGDEMSVVQRFRAQGLFPQRQ